MKLNTFEQDPEALAKRQRKDEQLALMKAALSQPCAVTFAGTLVPLAGDVVPFRKTTPPPKPKAPPPSSPPGKRLPLAAQGPREFHKLQTSEFRKLQTSQMTKNWRAGDAFKAALHRRN